MGGTLSRGVTLFELPLRTAVKLWFLSPVLSSSLPRPGALADTALVESAWLQPHMIFHHDCDQILGIW